ncbi:protein of unknown function [Paenibacillus alvei]|uniref:Uncharacterized protein n=1 Tax=Paenibacillus alvei TaxID=44250 RepID=A0A383RJS1_PAEAL|nr:protein of unknown function [Paenibacillus alvei]
MTEEIGVKMLKYTYVHKIKKGYGLF